MSYITINDKEYKIPEVNFDAICELEENGIQLVGMDRKNVKMLTMIRGIAAWIMGVDIHTASRELEAHILNGGDATEIMTAFMTEADKSGFFGGKKKQPQDHNKKVQNYRNRERNTDPTQRS